MAIYSQIRNGPDDDAFNPATGFPMAGCEFGVDVAGNPFGMDLHAHTLGDMSLFDAGDMCLWPNDWD